METILAVALIETFLINAVTLIERRKRRILLIKWLSGNITLEEIKILKKQSWFVSQFKQVSTSIEKKTD
jgi:hypothetical protein